MYNYKQRYLSALFEDSGKFLNSLITAHREKKEGVELEFTPKNCQAVIMMPLILLKKVSGAGDYPLYTIGQLLLHPSYS